MKRYLILPILFLVFISAQVHASYIATFNHGTHLNAAYNDGTQNKDKGVGAYDLKWYVDYNSWYNWEAPFATTVGFCIQPGAPAHSGNVGTSTLWDFDAFKKAAWLMDSYYSGGNTDKMNSGLQLAIWDALGYTIIDPMSSINEFQEYQKGLSDVLGTKVYEDFSTDNYIAISSTGASSSNLGYDFQDMITTKPIPEPGTMMLVGLGLLGISALGRRKI